jgi:hypothetical protein
MVQRCQEFQRRTWCWSSPARPLPADSGKVMGERRVQLTPAAGFAFGNRGWRAGGAAGKLGEDTSGWLTPQGRELPEEAM